MSDPVIFRPHIMTASIKISPTLAEAWNGIAAEMADQERKELMRIVSDRMVRRALGVCDECDHQGIREEPGGPFLCGGCWLKHWRKDTWRWAKP